MNLNIKFSEEELEKILLKKIPESWGLKIIKNQFKINGGIIDVLARHPEDKSVYFVIEIKTGDITPDTVCQVLRYSQYMNSELSKNGRRSFYPVVIGHSISREESNRHLYKLLKIFEGLPDDVFYVQYSLYNLGLNGIQLNWIDKENKAFMEEAYKEFFSKYDKAIDDKYELEFENYTLKKELEKSKTKGEKK